jgi:hypothetical protein
LGNGRQNPTTRVSIGISWNAELCVLCRARHKRHSFAARTLVNWYRTGKDPAREMIKLTTYLGHADPGHTYWYLEAVPELFELASRRAEASPAGEVRP